jgi:hypothetical protein
VGRFRKNAIRFIFITSFPVPDVIGLFFFVVADDDLIL